MEMLLIVGVMLVLVVFWGIATSLRDLWKFRQFDLAMERCMRAGDLFLAWREARPFLYVGQSSYAQGLILEMLKQYEYAGSMFAYLRPNEDWMRAWRRILHEMPPEYDPDGSAPRGHSFWYSCSSFLQKTAIKTRRKRRPLGRHFW